MNMNNTGAVNTNTIEIGEKIKSFRKKREITQEQLAEYLNISFQSVSKWECGDSLPDITMLPKIALFFNVTTDELLCIDKLKAEQEIEDYFKRQNEAQAIGHIDEAIAIMREANTKYPGNFRLMKGLAGAIFFDSGAGRDEEYMKNARNEIISIGEKIRAECKDDSIRRDILQVMCYTYRDMGEREKAVKLVNENLPNVHLTTNIMLNNLLDGDELIRHHQGNLLTFMGFCSWDMQSVSRNFAPKDKLAVYEDIIKMYSAIFKNGDYGYYAIEISNLYIDIAKIYVELNDNSGAFENLNKAAELKIAFDGLDLTVPKPHTSPLINKHEFTGITKNYKGNQSHAMLHDIMYHIAFNPIREAAEFKEICETLEKYAKDDL
jgi:transcriptional regulator with XRE-family HTH domain